MGKVYGADRVEGCLQEVRDKFEAARPRLEALAFDCMVTEGPRSALRQIAYYAQGRLGPDDVNALRSLSGLSPTRDSWTITKVNGIDTQSNHQRLRAIDVAPLDSGGNLWWKAPKEVWEALGAIAEGVGFTWGGGASYGKTASKLGWDCPHWEI